jgi:ribosomal protein L18
MDKKESRLRRGRQTRIKIAQLGVNRLSVHRTNLHIYANLISPDAKVLVSASTLEAEVRAELAASRGGRQRRRCRTGRQARRRESTESRDHRSRIRPFGFPLPRPCEGAGRSRA